MLKSASRHYFRAMIATLTRALPKGAQQAILDGVVDGSDRFQSFQRIGSQLGVESVSVRGLNGLVWGSLLDYWVLGRYASRHRWATHTLDLFNQLFSNGGGTFLDIGANIGLTLFPVAQNAQVQCYGFEPEPRNFGYLTLGFQANCPHGNVVLKQVALFDRKDVLEFELSGSNFGDHRIRAMKEEKGVFEEGSRTTISVSSDRLDEVLAGHQFRRPLGIKIDTQGAEPGIFRGGEETVGSADLVSLEFAPYLMKRMGGDVDAELQTLATRFNEGAVALGESDELPQWRSIASVVEQLAAHWRNPEIATTYFDVLVRK
jgi:FkbM family methyltransferase